VRAQSGGSDRSFLYGPVAIVIVLPPPVRMTPGGGDRVASCRQKPLLRIEGIWLVVERHGSPSGAFIMAEKGFVVSDLLG